MCGSAIMKAVPRAPIQLRFFMRFPLSNTQRRSLRYRTARTWPLPSRLRTVLTSGAYEIFRAELDGDEECEWTRRVVDAGGLAAFERGDDVDFIARRHGGPDFRRAELAVVQEHHHHAVERAVLPHERREDRMTI